MYIILPPLKYKLSACHKKIYSQLNKHKNGVPPKNNGLKDNSGMLAKSGSIVCQRAGITINHLWQAKQVSTFLRTTFGSFKPMTLEAQII